ncbi:glycosyltransferase family 4 protein [Ectobacillus funiculus]|uniref:glycosyltransferase family 4 protein n=1 Tax=Ectobacillus funiculus TaxID=137993 RepID=UPI00397D72BF
MPQKVLFCATIDNHFKAFHLPYMKWFKEQGWEVHVAASGNLDLPYVDKKYNISIQRSPFKLKNFDAYKELKAIIDKNGYKIIHCHTPMGGVLSRLAARKARKYGTKVIYTAHGFHFCQGAPLINWLLYYPIEKGLARYTDCLITINEEDYNLALKHRFKAGRIEHVHGVGVNIDRFKPVEEARKRELKKSSGYKPDDFLMFYAAEFNKNKNQQLLIHALALLKDEVPTARLLLAGEGPLVESCRELAHKLGVGEMVHFLGYRRDIDQILPMCDIAVASSLREGLPVNIMEAMACGLPIVASDNRGHRELIRNNENGWVLAPDNISGMADRIKVLAQNDNVKIKLGTTGRNILERKYAIDKVLDKKSSIYALFMEEMEEFKWAIH